MRELEYTSQEESKEYLSCYDGYIVGEELWFSNVSANGLFRMNMKTEEVKFVKTFPNELLEHMALHKRVISYKDQLFFFAEAGHGVHKYDMTTGEMQYFEQAYHRVEFLKTADVIVKEKYVWVIPQHIQHELFRFDMETNEIVHYPQFNQTVQPYVKDEQIPFCIRVAEKDGRAWFAINNTNYIMSWEFTSFDVTVYELELDQLYGVFSCADKLWVTRVGDSCVYQWNPDTNKMIPFTNEHITVGLGKLPYFCMVSLEEKTFILETNTLDIYQLELENKRVGSKIELPEGYKQVNDIKKDWPHYQRAVVMKDKLYIFPVVGNMMLVFDGLDWKGIKLKRPDEWKQELVYREKVLLPYIETACQNQFIIQEEHDQNLLENYISVIENEEFTNANSPKQIVGERIFDCLMKAKNIG